jgi:membrane protease YdiL (CAAX protease family)
MGFSGIIALAGLWTVLTSLVRTPPNVLPGLGSIPALSGVAFLLVSIVAAPLTEEIAFRGYAMGLLRRHFGTVGAIIISSIMFAAAHLTQGLYATKLVVYLLVGLALAITVWRTGSLLPAMAVHSFGDLVFFTTIWPHDATRRLVSEGGADAGFYVSVACIVIFSAIWVFGFRRLLAVTRPASDRGGATAALATA